MNYQYYVDTYKGELDKPEFDRLISKVEMLVKAYVDSLLRIEQIKDTLNEYGNFNDALCLEVDYLQQNGGVNALNGSSDLDIKQVQTSGYTFQIGSDLDEDERSFNGIPFSPLAKSMILTKLRKQGLLSMRWNT